MRVVLAAGLVFGIGSFATLAAWTDTENATGSFGASIFDTESATTPALTYASNTTPPGPSLTFNATAMSPNVAFYAWMNVRTTTTTNVAGTVSLTGVAATGTLAPALQYRAVRMTAASPTATCNAAAFTAGTPTFIVGNASTWVPVTTVAPTPVVPSAIAAGGAAIGYCFEVRIPTGTASTFQGTTATVTWTFTSTSNS